MSRIIDDTSDVKRNLWGATTTNGVNGLEAQRNDLWYADFTSAVTGVAQAFGQSILWIIRPQMVQSVSFPENRLKVEEFRRYSIPFMMPCWDQPFDTMRMNFYLDTNKSGNSYTLQFLTNWLELARAGRGFRGSGYSTNESSQAPVLLDERYRSNYRFDSALHFVRGASSAEDFSTLEVWQTLRLKSMWLAGLKISDLNYSQAGFVMVEGTFYLESIDVVPIS